MKKIPRSVQYGKISFLKSLRTYYNILYTLPVVVPRKIFSDFIFFSPIQFFSTKQMNACRLRAMQLGLSILRIRIRISYMTYIVFHIQKITKIMIIER